MHMEPIPIGAVLQHIWAAQVDAHAKLLLIYLADLESYRKSWVSVRDAARALGLRPSRVLAMLYLLHGEGYITLRVEDGTPRYWFSVNWDRMGVRR
jgi:DNA-binding IclR family transcriptional regulator